MPVGLGLDLDPHLLIFGDGRSGKSTLLRNYLHEVIRSHTPETAQMFDVDYRRANLGELSDDWSDASRTSGVRPGRMLTRDGSHLVQVSFTASQHTG